MKPQQQATITLEEARAISKKRTSTASRRWTATGSCIRISWIAAIRNIRRAGTQKVFNNARVFTPEDVAMQTPNSDTPYSQLGLDLRTEPQQPRPGSIMRRGSTRKPNPSIHRP